MGEAYTENCAGHREFAAPESWYSFEMQVEVDEGFNAHRSQYRSIRNGEDVEGLRSHQAVARTLLYYLYLFTYFLFHQMDAIRQGVTSLHEYLGRKATEIEDAEKLLKNSRAKGRLNCRQLSLSKHALKNPNGIYKIQEHQSSHAISYQTARTDLLKMSDDLNLLRKRKYGNSFVFVALPDLKTRLIENRLQSG